MLKRCIDYLLYFSAGRKTFREFLRLEYSEENMLFWLACEELKSEENPELVEEKARLIYEDYISILSPKEVSAFFAFIVCYNIIAEVLRKATNRCILTTYKSRKI